MEKPTKKSDKELWNLIEQQIRNGNYLFLPHAKKRQKDRSINDYEVLEILINKVNRKRQRNKRKDIFIKGFQDWNYCIEGLDVDENKIRIIISFEKEVTLLIITVIRLEQ